MMSLKLEAQSIIYVCYLDHGINHINGRVNKIYLYIDTNSFYLYQIFETKFSFVAQIGLTFFMPSLNCLSS